VRLKILQQTAIMFFDFSNSFLSAPSFMLPAMQAPILNRFGDTLGPIYSGHIKSTAVTEISKTFSKP